MLASSITSAMSHPITGTVTHSCVCVCDTVLRRIGVDVNAISGIVRLHCRTDFDNPEIRLSGLLSRIYRARKRATTPTSIVRCLLLIPRTSTFIPERERERERERNREKETERQRETETEREKDKERGRGRERKGERGRDKQRERERKIDRERESEGETEREREREKYRESNTVHS